MNCSILARGDVLADPDSCSVYLPLLVLIFPAAVLHVKEPPSVQPQRQLQEPMKRARADDKAAEAVVPSAAKSQEPAPKAEDEEEEDGEQAEGEEDEDEEEGSLPDIDSGDDQDESGDEDADDDEMSE